uniref:Putative serine/threonine-protein kinase At1g01540 n=1 Tax=Rhizophora mucronata TaxID=61149 RepID=A0A2P2QPA8_RHIMU
MGHVIHMLESDEFPFRDDRKAGRKHGHYPNVGVRMDKHVSESGGSNRYDS